MDLCVFIPFSEAFAVAWCSQVRIPCLPHTAWLVLTWCVQPSLFVSACLAHLCGQAEGGCGVFPAAHCFIMSHIQQSLLSRTTAVMPNTRCCWNSVIYRLCMHASCCIWCLFHMWIQHLNKALLALYIVCYIYGYCSLLQFCIRKAVCMSLCVLDYLPYISI